MGMYSTVHSYMSDAHELPSVALPQVGNRHAPYMLRIQIQYQVRQRRPWYTASPNEWAGLVVGNHVWWLCKSLWASVQCGLLTVDMHLASQLRIDWSQLRACIMFRISLCEANYYVIMLARADWAELDGPAFISIVLPRVWSTGIT